MKKCLIIANHSVGLNIFRKELMEKLADDYELFASTPNNGFFEELSMIPCKMIETKIDCRGMNPIKDLQLLFTYIKILKRINPDIVITYTIKPNIYGGLACRFCGIRYASNITGLGSAFQNDGPLKMISTFLYKFALKKAMVVFFENVANKQVFIDAGIVPGSKTYLLNGAGVNLEKFPFKDYPKDGIIKFLFMGRIMKEKGIDELFCAMRRLISEGIECSLDAIGYYEDEYDLTIRDAEQEGWLKYHGFQKNVHPFIEECHCFVLPSWHEGMANTNLESAASGRPIITSNIHGCLEAVENGVTGFLCERKNSDDLYRAMKIFTKMSYEERKQMGLAGRKRMEEIFDKRKVVDDTISHL